MRLVLSFGFNDTWLILIRCSFSVITSVITVWHMVSFTVGTLKTTHSATVGFSFVSRQRWSSQLGSCCVVVCGFHTDVKETEWLSTQMRSQASLLKSQCVSGYQTEVWTHWRSFYLLRERTQWQGWVSYAMKFVSCSSCLPFLLIFSIGSVLEFLSYLMYVMSNNGLNRQRFYFWAFRGWNSDRKHFVFASHFKRNWDKKVNM